MAAAIATLPWAEQDSIHADGKSLKVKFAVTDPKQFDEQLVIATLKKKGYAGAKLASDPPGTKTPDKPKDADKPKEKE